MLGVGWRYVLAAVVGVILVGSLQPEKALGQYQVYPNQTSRGAQYVLPGPFQKSDGIDGKKKPCGSDEESRNSDLCAQWKAADAAVDSAYWTKLTFFSGVFTLIAAVVAALYAKRAAQTAQRTFGVQTGPFLTVCFENVAEVILNRNIGQFTPKSGNEEIWFYIKNSGLTPIVIETLCRRWTVCARHEVPSILEYPNTPEPSFSKKCHIPVAPNQNSFPIKMGLVKFASPNVGQSDFVYFDGYIVFRNLRQERFVAGFCAVYDDGRFQMAWPSTKPEKYNYHKKLA